MYLSRIELDCARRETQKALVSVNRIHGAVEAAFPNDRERKLWRLDDLYGKKYLLIVSKTIPDFTPIQEQFGFQNAAGETLDYSPLFDRLSVGSKWRFRLTANPVYSEKVENQRGRVHAQVSQRYMYEWLIKRAETNGFSVDPGNTDIKDIKWVAFKKHGERDVHFKSVTYEGILEIKDSEKVKSALINGIGREKAYGMGMLTLIRI